MKSKEMKLRKLDLDNEFSFYQADIGKEIYSELIARLNRLKGKVGQDDDVAGELLKIIDAKMKIEILSLIYTIEGQDWSIEVQASLRDYFGKANPLKYNEDIKSFFIFFTPYITADLQIFSALNTATK